MSKCLILVILDSSGSMDEKKSDTIKGFNMFLNEQKNLVGDLFDACFYLITFNSEVSVVYRGVPFDGRIEDLDQMNYRPSGHTALYDAVVEGIEMVEKDKTEKDTVLVAIITDGEDNCSKRISATELWRLIETKEKLKDWDFMYIGVSPIDWSKNTGTPLSSCEEYNFERPEKNFEKASSTVSTYRQSQSPSTGKIYTNL